MDIWWYVKMMKQPGERKGKYEKYPSLYDVFKPGDRVKRSCTNKDDEPEEYEGIIMGMDDNSMEIFWDTVNRKYRPEEIDANFTNCSMDEIFKGSERYTPIRNEKHKYKHILKVY